MSVCVAGDIVGATDYNRLVLRDVWRVESPTLWLQYHAAKAEVQFQMQRTNHSHLAALRTRLQEAYRRIPEMQVDSSINEVFLLHGTRPDILFKVLSNGLIEGFCGGKFGQVRL